MNEHKYEPAGREFTDVIRSIINEPPSSMDPGGSYTGKPEDIYDTPVQDADDL